MLTIFVGVDSVLRHKNAKWCLKKHQMITGHKSYFISHIHCHFPFNSQFKLKIEKRSRQFFFTFSYSQTSSLGLRLRGLPVENEILALGIDDSAEQKFGTSKELIVLNIFKYIFFVNTMSRDQFPKNRKLLTNWWPVEKQLSNNTFLIYIKYF